ncbi:MAG: BlaI/MecI/CopY family transcriptional regulator [Oscillospiraceae bacterium]|jgi:BlaI family penicillinase repressor|nr:BlaI/MecI/CopY family transcriptional regulator [Oscillospiraceae bacterium]
MNRAGIGRAEKISASELELMRILWREGRAVSFGELRQELAEKVGWEKSTIATLLRRLRDKGAVIQEEGGARRYSACVTREEYALAEEKNMLDKLYSGSAKNFVAALCRRGELSEADIDELKEFFQLGGRENGS